jgi:hypothetical protein
MIMVGSSSRRRLDVEAPMRKHRCAVGSIPDPAPISYTHSELGTHEAIIAQMR